MSEEKAIVDSLSTWQENIKCRERVESPQNNQYQTKLGLKYFTAICTLAFKLDLENEYCFALVLYLINSLLILRGT